MMPRRIRQIGAGDRSGFTLVELLVVLSIITLLIAILLPSIAAARERARAIVCASNSRQSVIAATLWTYDAIDRLPSMCNPPKDVTGIDPAYFVTGLPYANPNWTPPTPPGIYSATPQYGYAQRYMARKYLDNNYSVFRCPTSKTVFDPGHIWGPGYFSHMGWSGFSDYKNRPPWFTESWGRGHWYAYNGDPILLTNVVSPRHKIFWLDGEDFYYTLWSQMCGSSINGGYYDKNFTRHLGGVNTIMVDGHHEFHKDEDLGSGDGEYNNTIKRYWWAYNLEQ